MDYLSEYGGVLKYKLVLLGSEVDMANKSLISKIDKLDKDLNSVGVLYNWLEIQINGEELADLFPVYSCFDDLSNILLNSYFSDTEIKDIVVFILDRNLRTKVLEHSVYDINKFLSYKSKHLTHEEFAKLAEDVLQNDYNLYSSLKSASDDELNEKERRQKMELHNCLEECSVGDDVKELLITFRDNYVRVYTSLDSENIHLLTNALKESGFDERVIEIVRNELSKTRKSSNKYEKSVKRFVSELYDYCNTKGSILIKNVQSHILNEKNSQKSDLQRTEALARLSILYGWFIYTRPRAYSHTFIGNLSTLTDALNNTSLSKEEMTDIVFYVISENIKCGLFDSRRLDKNDVIRKNLNSYFACIISMGKLYEFTNYPTKDYRDEAMYEKYTLQDIDFSVDEDGLKRIIDAHLTIREHYLDKRDSYTEADILEVLKALKILNLGENVIKNIKRVLREKFVRKTNEGVTDIKGDYRLEPKVQRTPMLKKGTINALWRRLEEYFDFDKMVSFRYLTNNEIIYCVCILRKLDVTRDTIDSFIRTQEKFNESCMGSVMDKYVTLENKVEFYQTDVGIFRLYNR